jgi:ribosomal protein S8E
VKWRALRLDTGNYSWGSEAVTRKTRILDVVYNASNNELVRTQTLVKSAIVQVDAAPFKQWYVTHYGVEIGRKKKSPAAKKDVAEVLIYAKKSFSFLIWKKFSCPSKVLLVEFSNSNLADKCIVPTPLQHCMCILHMSMGLILFSIA